MELAWGGQKVDTQKLKRVVIRVIFNDLHTHCMCQCKSKSFKN